MRNLFAIRENDPNRTPVFSGDCFTTRRIDPIQQKTNEQKMAQWNQQMKSHFMPLFWVSMVGRIVFFVSIVGCYFILQGALKLSFGAMYQRFEWLFFASGFGLIVGGILLYKDQSMRKSFGESEVMQTIKTESEAVIDEIQALLEIPKDAQKMDFFAYPYGMKNGKMQDQSRQRTRYNNYAWFVFCTNGNLSIADLTQVISIPLASIVAIQEINKRIDFTGWNKDIPFHKPPYKPYHYRKHRDGTLSVKTHYAVFIRDLLGEFVFLIPPHELPLLRSWTGLEPQMANTKKS